MRKRFGGPRSPVSVALSTIALFLSLLSNAAEPAERSRLAVNASLNIVFIGDSITEAVGDSYTARDKTYAPPVYVSRYLSMHSGIGKVNYSNQGHSGYTTINFLPSQGDTFKAVELAADNLQKLNEGHLVFSVMLGTNDSAVDGPLGSPVSTADYRKNMNAIVGQLLKDYPGCEIIVHRPTWYSPNTHNGSRYLAEGLRRLQSYFPEIESVVKAYGHTHPGQVVVGDKHAFDFFRRNYQAYLIPERGQDGTFYLHPNQKGAEILGAFWGKAICKSIAQCKDNE